MSRQKGPVKAYSLSEHKFLVPSNFQHKMSIFPTAKTGGVNINTHLTTTHATPSAPEKIGGTSLSILPPPTSGSHFPRAHMRRSASTIIQEGILRYTTRVYEVHIVILVHVCLTERKSYRKDLEIGGAKGGTETWHLLLLNLCPTGWKNEMQTTPEASIWAA